MVDYPESPAWGTEGQRNPRRLSLATLEWSVLPCGCNATIPWEAGRCPPWRPRCQFSFCSGCWPPGEQAPGNRHWRGLLAACAVALLIFRMPASMIVASALVGAVFAALPHHLADRRRCLPLRSHGEHRSVRGDESLGGQAVGGPPAPGGTGGVLVRGVHRGSCRVWRSGRHLRGVPGGAGVPAVPGGLALPDRQHCAGGLGGDRHSPADPQRGDRTGRRGPERAPRVGFSPCSPS